MEKITIIIPVYNVEKYLKEAVDSAINQTYKNIEILLIDDGSTDNSGKICDDYLKIDKRIKVIHQENKGLSGARNTGLENTTGEYIMFLDSDDMFEKNACQIMLDAIKETNSDYVTANYINIDEDGKKWENPVFSLNKYKKFKLSIKDYENSFLTMNSGVWNKIFRKSFLDSLNMKFVERIPAEDAVFTTYCFIKSENVYYIPNIVYLYRQRYSDSISNSCSFKYFQGINKAYKIIYENFKENNELEFYRYYYTKSMNYILYKFIDSTQLTKEERVIILDDMRWFYELSTHIKIPTILKSVKYIIESIVDKDYKQALKYCEILEQIRKMLPKELKEKMSKPSASTYKEIKENVVDIELLERKQKLLKKIEQTPLNILDLEDSFNKLKNEKKSISRFGDGELDLIIGKNLKFQEHNKQLSKRLEEILRSKQNFCIIGVPDVLNGFNNLTEESEAFWIKNMERTRDTWLEFLNKDMEYATANLTRLYIRHKDRSDCGKYFEILKSLWKNRDVLICEGEQTRVGVGNDLLDGAKSIRRVICPSEDAFKKYNEILARVKMEDKDVLIIMALGPTATVLAYDLAKEGYQALDLGHFDIEYEWFKRNATKKEKISNKYTNEVNNGNETEEIKDSSYKKQINTIIK